MQYLLSLWYKVALCWAHAAPKSLSGVGSEWAEVGPTAEQIATLVLGIFTAGLSDRVGRRPTLLVCMVLLSLASFCCGCAGRIEWFFAARVLQGFLDEQMAY